MTPLCMKSKSKHYRKKCSQCGQRVRAGKWFVIDPVDSERIFHVEHYRRAK